MVIFKNYTLLIKFILVGLSFSLLISCKVKIQRNITKADKAYILYNANIIEVKSGAILKNKAVLIQEGIIKYIGDYSEVKAKSQNKYELDAKDKYIIPGLWDMHVHIEGEDLVEDNKALFPVYLAYGITTVRDMASDLGEQVLKWRDEINEGKLLGPRIYTAGLKLEGVNSIWKGDLEIADELDLEEMLQKLDKLKVDLIKITDNTLPGPLFLKSVIEAKKRGYAVSGHVPHDLTIRQLASVGFSSIEHASYLIRLGMDERNVVDQIKSGKLSKMIADDVYLNNFDQDIALQAYYELANSNVAVTPTLIGGKQLAYLDEDDHRDDEFLNYLTTRFTDKYKWRLDRIANNSPEQKQKAKDRYTLISQQLPYLQKAGISILAGSDAAALNTYVYPALALHQELELFQKSGLTPLNVLQSATINGAKFMNKLNASGSIDEGKDADMIILNSNPLLNITSTQDIFGVVYKGQYFDRSELDLMLQTAKQKKIHLDEDRARLKKPDRKGD